MTKQEQSSPTEITLVVENSASAVSCVRFGHFSKSYHGKYRRRRSDLPADGRGVILHVRNRKFLCTNCQSRLRVFAERVPEFLRPHARRTERRELLFTRIGVFLDREAGLRLSREFHVPASGNTILCVLYRTEISPCLHVREASIDERAWRKGHLYGTIACDLATRRPVKLLPEARD